MLQLLLNQILRKLLKLQLMEKKSL